MSKEDLKNGFASNAELNDAILVEWRNKLRVIDQAESQEEWLDLLAAVTAQVAECHKTGTLAPLLKDIAL